MGSFQLSFAHFDFFQWLCPFENTPQSLHEGWDDISRVSFYIFDDDTPYSMKSVKVKHILHFSGENMPPLEQDLSVERRSLFRSNSNTVTLSLPVLSLPSCKIEHIMDAHFIQEKEELEGTNLIAGRITFNDGVTRPLALDASFDRYLSHINDREKRKECLLHHTGEEDE
jgi:hypothetical protein